MSFCVQFYMKRPVDSALTQMLAHPQTEVELTLRSTQQKKAIDPDFSPIEISELNQRLVAAESDMEKSLSRESARAEILSLVARIQAS
jgi:hypothetical protein